MSEFSKAVESAKKMNLKDDFVTVIGDWTIVRLNDSGSDSQGSGSDSESPYASYDSEPEEDGNRPVTPTDTTHTVTFKVIGCTKEPEYQHILEKSRDLLDEGCLIHVKLSPEPGNPFDPKAIAFICELDGKFPRIGYVVREVQEAVRTALAANEITDVSFKWIKYVTDWYRCGPGFFAGVNITKRGIWPSVVVRARSTR